MQTWGEQNIVEGDEIIVSHLEHHANIVPWYQLTKKTGAKLRVIPVDDTGQIILEELPKLINERTKLLSITQVSNALGTVTPVAEVIKIAHAKGYVYWLTALNLFRIYQPMFKPSMPTFLCSLDIKCLDQQALAPSMQNQNC